MTKQKLIALVGVILLAIASPFVGIALYRDAHSVKSDLSYYYLVHTEAGEGGYTYYINYRVQYYELYEVTHRYGGYDYKFDLIVITVDGERLEFDGLLNPATVTEQIGSYDCISRYITMTENYKQWC